MQGKPFLEKLQAMGSIREEKLGKMKEHRICVANCFQMNVHGVVDGCQHLHHELGVQQHAVTRFPPELLLLPGEATHTQPEGETQTYSAANVKWQH